MMKRSFRTYLFLLSGFLLLKLPQPALATHVMGGEIVAETVSCNSYTYKVKVILYADAGADIEFGSGIISFGDGNILQLYTENDFEYSESGKDSMYKVATYEVQHSFPGPGRYLINFKEFNRDSEIVNMRNSVNTPFYTETLLTIDPLTGCNNTPVLSEEALHFMTHVDTPYILPLHATDPDGDSLSFTFVTPKQDADIAVDLYYSPEQFDIRFIEGATASDGQSTPTLTVNNEHLVWDAPNVGGAFTFALQVNEWRRVDNEWTHIGYITRDMTIHVEDTINHTHGADYITDIQDEVKKPALTLYPNPSTGPITLTIREDVWQRGTVSIYNILGQLIAQKPIDDEEIDFDLTGQSEGVYLVILKNGDAQKTLRFLKK